MPKESENKQAESFKMQVIYYSDPHCNFIASHTSSMDFFPGCKMKQKKDGETEYFRDFCEKEKISEYSYKDKKCKKIKNIII